MMRFVLTQGTHHVIKTKQRHTD